MGSFKQIPAVSPALESWLVVMVNPFALDPSDRFTVVGYAVDVVAAHQQGEQIIRDNPGRAYLGDPILLLAQIRMTVEKEKEDGYHS